jgi:Zn-dependent metalloprotease
MKCLRATRLCLPLIALLIVLGALPAAAAPPTGAMRQDDPQPAPEALQALQALQTRAAAPLDVSWDPLTGVAEQVAASGRDARLPYAPPRGQKAEPLATALGFLEANRPLFGLRDAAAELRLKQIEPDPRLGWHHVRLDQVYRGIPVFGRQLVVHLDKQLRVVSVNGQLAPGLDIDTEPRLTAEQAIDVALRNLRQEQLEPLERLRVQTDVRRDKTRLVVYVDRSGRATLTWQVTILTSSPLGQWHFFVHARRPLVVHALDSLTSAKRRITYSAQNSTRLPGRKLIDEGERSRNEVAQAAHDNAGITYDYYWNNFQRDSVDGRGLPIVSTVNYGSSAEDAENAAWIGELQQMIYGDGGRIFRPLPFGLDVVAHELTHGITDNTAGLIYEGQSGALNEAYSDIMAAMIDTANWTMGEQVVLSPPFPAPVLRSLEDPTLGGLYDPNNPLAGVGQPATAAEYANLPISRRYDNGGVHINSGIPNRAAFLVAQALGREKTGQIYYRTLTQYLTPSTDFFDHARLTIQSARELYGDADATAVRNAFAQVGIDPGDDGSVPSQAPEGGQTVPGSPSGPSTPSPAPVPAGCTDIIVNGGFENDDAWVEVTAGEFAIIDAELPYSGRRSAWLGGQDQEAIQFIFQELRVPPNVSSLQLRYARLIHQETTGILSSLTAADANFGVLVLNAQGDVLGTVQEYSSTQGDDTWREEQYDVTELAGKTIRLAFAAENPRGNISSFFVDDVALISCTSGQAPQAPTPRQADAVFVQGTITDVNTGRGVAGAQVFVMRQGLSASRAVADGTITEDEVIAYGVSDRRGGYQTEAAVPRGQTYSVIVYANGYRPIIADNEMAVPANATNPFVVDATLRR